MPRKRARRTIPDSPPSERSQNEPHSSNIPPKRARRTITDSPPSVRGQSGRPSPELGNTFDNVRYPPLLQSLREVHIALDTGTERTKASIVLQYTDKRTHGASMVLPAAVIWPNCSDSVLTQVAFGDERRMFWGDGVEQELKKRGITESQVIRRLKPSLFDAHALAHQPFQKGLLVAEDRKVELTESLKSCGEDADDYRMENLSVFSDYMGIVYRYVLQFIAKTHGSLGWPVLKNLEEYKNWSPPGNPKIHVSLPVPVGSSPDEVQLVVAAAKAAGIPNPYPVAEPASALIHHLCKARDQSIKEKTFLILDIGAGSVDQQVWTVVNENPLQVREHIIPEHVRTAWCGGAYTNQEAVKLIMNGIRDRDLVLRALQRHGSRINNQESLERKLDKKFEKEKQRFEGWETLLLRIPGLPDIPEFRLGGGGIVVLEPKDVKSAFAPCLNQIIAMLDTAIQSVFESRTLRGMVERRVHEIIVRYVRRSFCVECHEEVNAHLYPPQSRYRSPHDHQIRVPVTRFLLRQGLHPQCYSSEPLQGWRGLFPHERFADGTWLIEETLYYSDTVSQDKLWIHDHVLGIRAMPGTLNFHISTEEAQRFPQEQSPTDGPYYYLDYELILTLDGHIMTFKFIIPRTGRWPTHGDRYANVMYRTGQYDTAGVSQLFSSA
ncbi:hypothetical protein CLAIMM_14973 [Cladophialophora immunda]|nr:hypothetical protein CLAIMM_14973 [Cladophialophora immunda]